MTVGFHSLSGDPHDLPGELSAPVQTRKDP
jgi:hypothetical protein